MRELGKDRAPYHYTEWADEGSPGRSERRARLDALRAARRSSSVSVIDGRAVTVYDETTIRRELTASGGT
jgi:hypothetical protein